MGVSGVVVVSRFSRVPTKPPGRTAHRSPGGPMGRSPHACHPGTRHRRARRLPRPHSRGRRARTAREPEPVPVLASAPDAPRSRGCWVGCRRRRTRPTWTSTGSTCARGTSSRPGSPGRDTASRSSTPPVYLAVADGDGDNEVAVQAHRPPLEREAVPQVVFLDFDGATVDTAKFEIEPDPGVRTLSPSSTFLPRTSAASSSAAPPRRRGSRSTRT